MSTRLGPIRVQLGVYFKNVHGPRSGTRSEQCGRLAPSPSWRASRAFARTNAHGGDGKPTHEIVTTRRRSRSLQGGRRARRPKKLACSGERHHATLPSPRSDGQTTRAQRLHKIAQSAFQGNLSAARVTLTRLQPHQIPSIMAQIWPSLRQRRPIPGQVLPNLSDFGPHLANGPTWDHKSMADFGPQFVDSGPKFSAFGRVRSKFGRSRPTDGHFRAQVGRS